MLCNVIVMDVQRVLITDKELALEVYLYVCCASGTSKR